MEVILIEGEKYAALMEKLSSIEKHINKQTSEIGTGKDIYTLKEAANYLGISANVLSVKACSGEVKGYKNGIWRFAKADLIRYALSNGK